MKNVKTCLSILFLTASFSTCTHVSTTTNAAQKFSQPTVQSSNAVAPSVDIQRKQDVTYQRYYNSKFNYSVAYPVGILVPQGEAQNGDGQKFLSKDKSIVMTVYGSHNVLNKRLEEEYRNQSRSATRENPTRVVSYKTRGNDWFVVSGYDKGKVFYNKTMLRNGDFKVLEIQYDKSLQRKLDPIVAEIAKSFRSWSQEINRDL